MKAKDHVRIAQAMHGCRISVRNGYPPAMTREERYRDEQRVAVHRAACYALADALAADSPEFDRRRFIALCGIPDGE
jgi:hypothetical protein